MDHILDRLVDGDGAGGVDGPGPDLNLTSDDMNDVMKVLTGLDDYAEAVGEAEAGVNSGSSKVLEDSFTSVQDMAKVVDKATLANEKVLEYNHRQLELERRFTALSRRLNKLRCLTLGSHISNEITSLRDYCEKAAPPLPPPMSFQKMPPNINFNALRGGAPLPDGVVLPSVPPMPPVSFPTQPLANVSLPTTPDVKVKEEIDEATKINGVKPIVRLPPPTYEEKLKVDEVLGQLNSNLHHMVDSFDSEATDSSSGGESCDESDNFPNRTDRTAPIKKRAKWVWLNNRASIASKWTWLTAQISDLEYRIRQQTDFYRQIRAAKGAVTLGEPTISWPAHARKAVHDPGFEVPLSCKPPTRDYSRVDSMGRKIIIKELAPMAISPEELAAAANQNDDTFTACRTRPIKTLRRRRILGTLGLHRTSTRAAKESTVKCDCIRPNYWCAICFGRSNHIMAPDPVSQDRSRTAALLDHSYHQVLSSKNDVPLELHMMQMIKNRSWLVSGAQAKAKIEAAEAEKKKKKLKKLTKEELLLENKNKRKLKRRESERGFLTKRIKTKHDKSRRKSVTVHHHDGGVSMVDIGAASDDAIDASPLPSPSVNSHMSLAEQIRKKRETAFDIDNIVIPYSIAASTRVEKLKYKEILTPTWRVIEDGGGNSVLEAAVKLDKVDKSEKTTEGAAPPTPPAAEKPKQPEPSVTSRKPRKVSRKAAAAASKARDQEALITVTAEMAEVAASAATTEAEYHSTVEDISEANYELRHSKAEVEEQKRWSKPLKVIGLTTASRSRSSRRQNSQADASSGCNTPDPMSPGSVEKMDTSEANTRPSTPDENCMTTPVTTPSSASIKNRRRTSSTTKSRDRNPSEDMSSQQQPSRCTTPNAEFLHPPYPAVEPFEPRKFPLSEDDYNVMLEEMPSGFDQPSEASEFAVNDGDMDSVDAALAVASSRRASSQDSSTFEDEPNEEEEEEEDPDWSGDLEDPDDPEWTSREELAANSGAASAGGTPTAQKGSKKQPLLQTGSISHQQK